MRSWSGAGVQVADRLGDEPDVPARRRELDGVVQQVHQHLRQPDRIGIERDRSRRAARPSGCGPAASIAGRHSSTAALTTVASSRRSLRSSTLPCVIRDTSSRSSTMRTMCVTWRSSTCRARAISAGVAVGAPQHLQREAHRRQRVAQLVGQDAQELVLAPVEQPQRLGVDAQRLGLARVGDVLDGQQHEVRRPAALDAPACSAPASGRGPGRTAPSRRRRSAACPRRRPSAPAAARRRSRCRGRSPRRSCPRSGRPSRPTARRTPRSPCPTRQSPSSTTSGSRTAWTIASA